MNQTIQKITVPQPCQQQWQGMTPNDEGRHCESCSKTVIDFKSMTHAQLIAYLTTHNNVCGRFSEPQLDRINLQLNQQDTQPKPSWKKWVMTMALLSSAGLYKVSGQTTSVVASKAEQNLLESYPASHSSGKTAVNRAFKREIKGQILDDANMPLHGATIKVEGTNMALPTDTGGRFKFYAPVSAKQFTVSFVGFETETVDIDRIQNEAYEVKLTPHIVSMNDVVVVTGYASHLYKDITGGVSIVMTAVTTKKRSWLWRMYYKYIRTPIHQIFH